MRRTEKARVVVIMAKMRSGMETARKKGRETRNISEGIQAANRKWRL
jgi:hypothetical protein